MLSKVVLVLGLAIAASAAPHDVEKRSVAAHAALAYAAPAAVSHQSRVDVHHTPALYSAPVITEPVVAARAVVPHLARTVYAGGAAVSHQSRVDVQHSPAVIASPAVYSAPSVYAAPLAHHAPAVVARTVYSAPDVWPASPAVYAAPYAAAPYAAAPWSW